VYDSAAIVIRGWMLLPFVNFSSILDVAIVCSLGCYGTEKKVLSSAQLCL
jgi:hypothetical protein